jgi:hypothetical protein
MEIDRIDEWMRGAGLQDHLDLCREFGLTQLSTKKLDATLAKLEVSSNVGFSNDLAKLQMKREWWDGCSAMKIKNRLEKIWNILFVCQPLNG